MDSTIDSNKDFIHYSEFCVCFLENFPIAVKKSASTTPEIKPGLARFLSCGTRNRKQT